LLGLRDTAHDTPSIARSLSSLRRKTATPSEIIRLNSFFSLDNGLTPEDDSSQHPIAWSAKMDFIERVFHVSPDAGSGMTELMFFMVPVLVCSLLLFRRIKRQRNNSDASD
jgi:hypothetical protein